MDGETVKGCRFDLLPADHPLKKLPDVRTAPHLVEYALEVGLCKSGGMGIVPIEWPDVAAWVAMTGTDIHPEEARIIMAASASYVSWSNKAKVYDCPAPFLESETSADRSATIKQQMQQFKNRRKSKR